MTVTLGAVIESFGICHVGKGREDNQDAIRFSVPDTGLTAVHGYLYGVADGMGGYSHGGIASSLALETLFTTFYGSNGASTPQKLRQAILQANLGVYQAARRLGVVRMGTTITAINVSGQEFHVAHVGDSRAYLVRGGRAICLTSDHTRVGDMVRARVLPPEKVRGHAQRSILSKCVGLELFVQPDISRIRAKQDDVIILCTDGIWSVVEDEEFGSLAGTSRDPETLCKRILDRAMNRDTDDNLSVIALYLRRLDHTAEPREKRRTWSLTRFLRRSEDPDFQ